MKFHITKLLADGIQVGWVFNKMEQGTSRIDGKKRYVSLLTIGSAISTIKYNSNARS